MSGFSERLRERTNGYTVTPQQYVRFAQAARGTTLALQINRDGKLEQIEAKMFAAQGAIGENGRKNFLSRVWGWFLGRCAEGH